MVIVDIPPAAVARKLPLTFGQWSALYLELMTIPVLFPKVHALIGAEEKALWLSPAEVSALQVVVENPRPRQGRQHRERCRQLARKLRAIRAGIAPAV
ncbi:hypothetical protein [Limnoglobus roseus]|uniref:Uncharacterized protein n=1 Tax=Limnoglobus roseus TaxID=2598579 RepID=A0A5C1AC57_9BACT|nr:hypothetical protein [Limnoglobus roseus]QEL16861.1 hypothetical protein PX52LOC_03835 [Limnoglobus roseus]